MTTPLANETADNGALSSDPGGQEWNLLFQQWIEHAKSLKGTVAWSKGRELFVLYLADLLTLKSHEEWRKLLSEKTVENLDGFLDGIIKRMNEGSHRNIVQWVRMDILTSITGGALKAGTKRLTKKEHSDARKEFLKHTTSLNKSYKALFPDERVSDSPVQVQVQAQSPAVVDEKLEASLGHLYQILPLQNYLRLSDDVKSLLESMRQAFLQSAQPDCG